jgi:beta-galactosidase
MNSPGNARCLGLIHLAEPRIESYGTSCSKNRSKPLVKKHLITAIWNMNHRYSWYRKNIHIPAELEGKEAMLSILKSKYVTQVYVNGMDVGQSVSCYTPIDLKVTQASKVSVKTTKS